MPLKRNSENRGLPARWVHKHDAYYFMPPEKQRAQREGKSWFRLGSTLPEAYKVWAERVAAPERITTFNALFDRYLLQEVPTKKPNTQTGYRRFVDELRKAFGTMALADIEPQHVYQYVDKRSAKGSARHEADVLSAALSKAVEWGLIRANPLIGQVKLKGAAPRTRDVEDWEIIEVLSLKPKRRLGSVGMVQAYLRLKLLTGLRQRDLLMLTLSAIKEDGIHVTPSKTKNSTGKRRVYEWSDELRAAVDAAKAVRPALSPFLFCNSKGAGYVNEALGTSTDWGNIWHNFMRRVLSETKVKVRFTEHDMRAVVAGCAESLERAQQLLGHSDSKVTQRVYRRKEERVRPLR